MALAVNQLSGFGSGAAGGAPRPEVTDAPDQSGILLHFRADIGITLNSGDVSSWEDQGTGGHDLTQGTAARQPSFSEDGGPNGTQALLFAGLVDGTSGDGDMQNTSWSHANPVHYFLAFKLTGWAADDVFFSGTASHNILMPTPGSSPSNARLTMTATPGALQGTTSGNIPVIGTWALGSFYYSDSGASFQINNTTPETEGSDWGPAAKLALGSNTAGTGAKGSFDIAEFLAYDEQKTGGDLTAIQNYFNDQYDLF